MRVLRNGVLSGLESGGFRVFKVWGVCFGPVVGFGLPLKSYLIPAHFEDMILLLADS